MAEAPATTHHVIARKGLRLQPITLCQFEIFHGMDVTGFPPPPTRVRPVAHSDGKQKQSFTDAGSPEPRVLLSVKELSGPASITVSMRPVAHDSPIPAKKMGGRRCARRGSMMKINIKTQTGKTITMNYVEESESIKHVKETLEWYHGIAGCRGKKLMQECPELADMRQLGVKDGDTLHLQEEPPQSKLMDKATFLKTPTGKTISLEVDVNDTMEHVKRKIAKMEGMNKMVLALHLEDGRHFSDFIIPGDVYVVYMLPDYRTPTTPVIDFGVV